MECSRDGIQRPPVAGIHGGEDGAYSIALSGGYEDDVAMGECFTYTGEGGRDLKGTKSNPKVHHDLPLNNIPQELFFAINKIAKKHNGNASGGSDVVMRFQTESDLQSAKAEVVNSKLTLTSAHGEVLWNTDVKEVPETVDRKKKKFKDNTQEKGNIKNLFIGDLEKPPIFLDALNIARNHPKRPGDKDEVEKPAFAYLIQIVVYWFRDKGYPTVEAIMRRDKRNCFDQKDLLLLDQLEKEGFIKYVPEGKDKKVPGQDDEDLFLLQRAANCGGFVVSNDTFSKEFTELCKPPLCKSSALTIKVIHERTIPFKIKKRQFRMPSDAFEFERGDHRGSDGSYSPKEIQKQHVKYKERLKKQQAELKMCDATDRDPSGNRESENGRSMSDHSKLAGFIVDLIIEDQHNKLTTCNVVVKPYGTVQTVMENLLRRFTPSLIESSLEYCMIWRYGSGAETLLEPGSSICDIARLHSGAGEQLIIRSQILHSQHVPTGACRRSLADLGVTLKKRW